VFHSLSNRTGRFLVFCFALAIALCSFAAAAADTPKSVQEKLALQMEEIQAHQGKRRLARRYDGPRIIFMRWNNR